MFGSTDATPPPAPTAAIRALSCIATLARIINGEGVGIGALGTAVLGIVLFNEPAHLLRIVSLGLIVLGVIGLKVA